MSEKRKRAIVILFVIGVVLIIGAPFMPSVLFTVIREFYDYHYVDIRFVQLIPSVRACGIILSVWGMVLLGTAKRD